MRFQFSHYNNGEINGVSKGHPSHGNNAFTIKVGAVRVGQKWYQAVSPKPGHPSIELSAIKRNGVGIVAVGKVSGDKDVGADGTEVTLPIRQFATITGSLYEPY
ncbi:MAG TPA: hypothetical protein VHP58_02820 [Alphaproteobacteria bacterium]|nr:hypothetical protein [Alphaproteobacteria bacterium]